MEIYFIFIFFRSYFIDIFQISTGHILRHQTFEFYFIKLAQKMIYVIIIYRSFRIYIVYK